VVQSYTGAPALAHFSDPEPGPTGPPSPVRAAVWQHDARCAGETSLMFDHPSDLRAKALCRACPVLDVCLWSTMVDEAAEEFRYGRAGGLRPAERRKLAAAIPRTTAEDRYRQALAAWRLAPRPQPPTWTAPRALRYRPWRKCRACKTTIIQPRAGRPQRWCSSACYQRSTRDRPADAARNRQRWAELDEDTKEARRATMRVRWARLSAEERAELAARKRQRRREQRQQVAG
jgi:hypothetical protein